MTDFCRNYRIVQLDNLARNYHFFASRSKQVAAVVKANAYGSGAVRVARRLQQEGCDFFAVSCLKEAMQLRANSIVGRILILGYTPVKFAPTLGQYRLTQTLHDLEYAIALNNSAGDQKIACHVKIDSGMNRLGVKLQEFDKLKDFFELNKLDIQGVFTHFCVSDRDDQQAVAFTRKQYDTFMYARNLTSNKSVRYYHCNNTFATLRYPEFDSDLARIGIGLHGLGEQTLLSPVDSVCATVTQVKRVRKGENVGYNLTFCAQEDMLCAVTSIGYADGLPRACANCGFMLHSGDKLPIIGAVSMDQSVVRLDWSSKLRVGDRVFLYNDAPSLCALSHCCDTIPYEILCLTSQRAIIKYI